MFPGITAFNVFDLEIRYYLVYAQAVDARRQEARAHA
jgi:hypothetical protein